ncbi:WD40 repeat-like protein [Neoconidiobolus thromboides FSU 785]|nr:WD40 repeat-like protein [Neoconidiobolus thromboides FSU 785]
MFKQLVTEGFNGYSVQFNPFFENKLAVASSANFGLVGNGRLFLLADTPEGIVIEKIFDTQDGLFDIAWSEENENHLITCSGDGSIKLWDANLNDFPIMNWSEHEREVFSVNWNLIKKDLFLSCSWDKTIKVFRPDRAVSIATFKEHSGCVYEASWSPYDPDLFASVSGDHSLKVWDLKVPNSTLTIPAHDHEVLSMDWNKYNQGQIVTGSADQSIKLWDIRNPRQPIAHLAGHQYAVRRVRCSPHHGNIVASSSYDMTVRLWDLDQLQGNPMVFVHDAHREFAMGIDFNLYIPSLLATCAWDEQVHLLKLP